MSDNLIQSLGLFWQDASKFTEKVVGSSKSIKFETLTFFVSFAYTVRDSTKFEIIGGEF